MESLEKLDWRTLTRDLALRLNRAELEKLSKKPAQPLLLLEGIRIEEVMEWISSGNSQEFGRFSIKDAEDCREVAEWFIRKVNEFYTFRTQLYTAGKL